ncbi:alginate O-acetyltransferase AlgX-related protein [Hymenobacter convexus]|uniref:alginate O-acetyltransferase AlgX-related protein n=1 Tax=Hymenobacter sp. CA1UV-4 TaxID=3063782 RepID=UPI0027139761|nr:hypothetical protein [Hymenobacter sp. CA1UV-4]MDO7850298.1 hypothetical protein [Hymenobacter sp. CA1UV-4]
MGTTTPSVKVANKWGKHLLLGFLLCLLVLPALQASLEWVPVGPLGGFFDPAPPTPELSWQTLSDNSYQQQMEKHLEMTAGFRNWLLRLRNQVAFTLFNQSRAPSLIIGKNNEFFGSNSVDAYFGRDVKGEEDLKFRCKRLRRVQDSLQAHGTQLLIVLAPGKARTLAAELPDSCDLSKVPYLTNYGIARDGCLANGVNLLDAAQLMARWQDTTHYPLFPRGGVHWSGYAVSLMADTLFRRVEHLTHLDLPDFASHGRTVATRVQDLRFTDNDLQELFNLMVDVPPYPVAYPNVVFGPETGKKRVNALIIGDSFAQSFYGFYPYYDKLLTPDSRYWSSNKQVFWPEKVPESTTVHDLDLAQQLAPRDVVIFICTEQNLQQFGFGFIEDAFNRFCPRTAQDLARIAAIENDIRKNADWLAKLTSQAEAAHEDVNMVIHNNAIYMQDRER